MLLGAQSKREVLRSRFRVLAAMQAQAVEQGRYLGGRPPYGYRLVDAGLHPNTTGPVGRRLQRLEPEPTTARHVRWIFAQRLAGTVRPASLMTSMPGACRARRVRTQGATATRTSAGWTLRTVSTILANPRYTGRQVWNRQRTDHDSADRGKRAAQRWNQPQDWVISKTIAHPALISEDDFVAVQAVTATQYPPTAPPAATRWSAW
jgi:site-specific DNA recombinase